MGQQNGSRSDLSTHRALEDFLTSREGPIDVRPHVLESWQRSRAAGVDPDSRTLPPLRYGGEELEDYRRHHLLSQGMQALRQLTRELIEGGQQLVVLTDANGVLLWVEGTPGVRDEARAMNFVPGAAWDEGHAGTNAPGVALRLGRDVEVLAGEHFSRVVQPWSCAAAVVRDFETGQVAGVLDITWPHTIDWPYALSVVRSAAGAIEGELLGISMGRRAQAEQRYVERAVTSRGQTALLAPSGKIVLAPDDHALVGTLVEHRRETGTALLADGRVAEAEPLGPNGYLMLSLPTGRRSPSARRGARRAAAPGPASLSALGRDEAILELSGRSVRLRPRFAEMVVLLALHPEGLSSEKLGLLLMGDDVNLITVRAEMSRLRAYLGDGLLLSRPYRLGVQVTTDFFKVRDALHHGRLRAALREYAGPLLPMSAAPGVEEERGNLALQLRAAVLSTRDPGLLRKWVETSWGSDDVEAWETLAGELPSTSSASASAAARAAALHGVVSPTAQPQVAVDGVSTPA
jgi:hypothetical protein